MNETNTEKRYELHGSLRSLLSFGLFFFSIGLVGSIVLIFKLPGLLVEAWWIFIPVIIGYIIYVKIIYSAWKERNNFITIDEDSITLHNIQSKVEVLNWSDIVQIKENHFLKSITIYGKHHKSIKVEYQLQNFNELLQYIIEKTPQLKTIFLKYEKFHKGFKAHLTLGVSSFIFMGLSIFFLACGKYIPMIIFIGLSFGSLFILSKIFTYIQLNKDQLVVNYPLKKESINLAEIKDISLESHTDNNGESSLLFVSIELKNQKKISFGAIKEGVIPLYCSLKVHTSIDS